MGTQKSRGSTTSGRVFISVLFMFLVPGKRKWEGLTISCISSACNLLDTDCPALILEGPAVLMERVGAVLELFSASLFMMRLAARILIPCKG